MSYTITNNVMYVRDDTGELVPVSMIASGADQTIQAIKDAAVAAESQIDTKVEDANAAIVAKTDEQAARIPEVTALAEDVSGLKDEKLDKTPGTWPVWTADEQKAAQERMGVDKEFATFEAQMTQMTKVLSALLKQNMNWNAVAELVRAGMGEAAFAVGTQFSVPHTAYGGGSLLFDVVAHDVHKNPNDISAHTMTLLMHDVIYGRQVDASELLWVNNSDSALAAGTYNFTLYKGSNGGQTYEDGTYQFTIAQPIPAGGGWTHPKVGTWYANAADYKVANITGATITTYNADGSVLETGIAVTAASGGTSLGTASNAKADCVHTVGRFNSIMRRAYGSNNWQESAIRQWLNSDAASGWWQRQTIFDMAPSYAGVAGFLNGIDPDFAAVLGEVDIVTARNTVYEMSDTLGGSYTTRDKVFLLSMAELGLGKNDTIVEGTVLPFYDGATQVDRIKYDVDSSSIARYWWMRSPNPWSAYYTRNVNPGGSLSGYSASRGNGAAAACVIY